MKNSAGKWEKSRLKKQEVLRGCVKSENYLKFSCELHFNNCFEFCMVIRVQSLCTELTDRVGRKFDFTGEK